MNKELLDFYTDYLITSTSQTTATSLSKLLPDSISHDKITRFLSSEDYWGLISFEGETGKLLEEDFREAIDSYLADCKTEGKTAEKPFKGSFNVRIPATLHQRAALLAMESKVSLNSFVAEAIRSWVTKEFAT